MMRKLTLLFGLSVFVLAVFAGYQTGSRELANVELQDDMQDLSTQLGTKIGLGQPKSDQDLRMAVVGKAKEHQIELMPTQVMVQRTRSGDSTTIYLAADYTVTIQLPGFSFPLHFTPSGGRKHDSEK
jgi:hypothetical protein